MKATELNGEHLGRTLTANIGRASVTDVLIGIDSSADVIQMGFLSATPDYVIGRRTITLSFANVGEVKANEATEITIHD
jgi:hypothetical protein